jgi:hypothetical protein
MELKRNEIAPASTSTEADHFDASNGVLDLPWLRFHAGVETLPGATVWINVRVYLLPLGSSVIPSAPAASGERLVVVSISSPMPSFAAIPSVIS